MANKFATGQIMEKPVEVLKGADFSWWRSKVSRTLHPRSQIHLILHLFEFESPSKGGALCWARVSHNYSRIIISSCRPSRRPLHGQWWLWRMSVLWTLLSSQSTWYRSQNMISIHHWRDSSRKKRELISFFTLPFSRRRATPHTSQEPWPWKSWEPKRNMSQGRPQHTSQNHVVWSRALECSVKPYVTGLSTECYFGEFLSMQVFTYDINRMNQWFVSVQSAMVSRFCVRPPSKWWFLFLWVDLLSALPFSRRRATSHTSQEPWPWILWEPKRNMSQGRPKHTSNIM